MGAEGLAEELAGINALLEAAAVAGDAEALVRHQMRKCALPILIREAKAWPIRERVVMLKTELEEIEHSRQAALREEPEVPAAIRGNVTMPMLRNRKLSGISARAMRVGRELDQARKELERIEAKG